MENINYYRNLLIRYYTAKNPDYNPEKDTGLNNKAVEIAIKAYYGKELKMSPAGKTDLRIGSRNAEVKTGAGELGSLGDRLLKGSGMVVYIPVLLLDYPITMQDGYVLERNDFLDALDEAGAIRTKTSTAGTRRVTIQTFWVAKDNKPHGRLLDRMLNAFDEHDAEALVDLLNRTEK